MDRQRTNELAEVVLQDLALAFELLRWVNSAQVRGAQVAGSGPVLTVRRAIAMLGLDGVRRAALGLRALAGAAGAETRPQRCARCSTPRNAPAAWRRRCARPATTPRWCTWSRCCRTWAA